MRSALWTPPSTMRVPWPPPSGGGGGGGGGSSGTPIDLGTFDFRPYARLGSPADPGGAGAHPADTSYEIPDGDYSLGDLTNAAHASTGGALGGAIELHPHTPYGATLHGDNPGRVITGPHNTVTTNGDLNIYGTTSRLILRGFNFLNTTMRILNDARIRFWYCDHQWPIADWMAEPGYPTSHAIHHEAPRLVDTWTSDISYSTSPDHIEHYGGDYHNCTTCHFPRSGTGHYTVVGAHCWNVDSDSSVNEAGGYLHNDFVGATGGGLNLIITDSFSEMSRTSPTVGIITESLSSVSFQYRRLWVTTGGSGIQVWASNGNLTTGVFESVYSWNNDGDGTGDPAWNYFEGSENGGGTLSLDKSGGLYFPVTPPGFGTPGADPASIWRAAHPYGSWQTYLGSLGWL